MGPPVRGRWQLRDIFALHLWFSLISSQCVNEDFSIQFPGNAKSFVISQSAGTCACPAGFVGPAGNLTALDQNPVVVAQTAVINAQAAQIVQIQALLAAASQNAVTGAFGSRCYQNSDCTAPNLVCSPAGRVCVGNSGYACTSSAQCGDSMFCTAGGVCSDPPNCKAIKTLFPSSTTGYTYRIDPDGSGPLPSMTTSCDMSTDGGGWTLAAYAGTITGGSKSATAGSCNFQPLFDVWGTYTASSTATATSFSRLDLFYSQLTSTTEIMARRTSVPSKLFIWPVAQPWLYWAPVGAKYLPYPPYLRLSITGSGGLKTVTNSITVFQGTSPFPNYIGYNWNTPAAENCDSCGRSFASALNHRSLLYWEPYDGPCNGNAGSFNSQWFHGSPITLADSPGPYNTAQDIEFWIR